MNILHKILSSGFSDAVCVVVVLAVATCCVTETVGAADGPILPTDASSSEPGTVRVASVQAKRRLIDWRIDDPTEVLEVVDKTLTELEQIIHQAGEQKCDVLAFPEDTLGLLNWYGMNEQAAKQVVPEAVSRMLDRLGRAAASHQMYLVVCSDFIETDGATYNTAFFLGRDGKPIGRYHKTCPTWFECGARSRGKSLPVFPTTDLGTVGMLICYDLVFPETARCLALAGADIIFFPTMGGAGCHGAVADAEPFDSSGRDMSLSSTVTERIHRIESQIESRPRPLVLRPLRLDPLREFVVQGYNRDWGCTG